MFALVYFTQFGLRLHWATFTSSFRILYLDLDDGEFYFEGEDMMMIATLLTQHNVR